MHNVNHKISKEKWIKKYSYLILFAVSLWIIDIVFRSEFIDYGVNEVFDIQPMLFNAFWILLLSYIIYMIHGFLKKVVMFLIILFFNIYILGQNAYYNLFAKYFSVLDASLLGEGAEFADKSYFKFNNTIVIACVVSILLVICACFCVPKEMQQYTKKQFIPILFSVILFWSAHKSVPTPYSTDVWNASTGLGNIYEDYTDTTKALLFSGVYEYTFRDVYLAYNPFNKISNAATIKEINEFIENRDEIHQENEMTGIFKDKNIMLIQLENIDTWMLTKENMPYMYSLREQSINFENHFATTFATGKTFNTEFIVNTGLIPQAKGAAPSYIYSRNEYPLSIASLFKSSDYEVNSFHESNGHVYNRGVVHNTFGYEQYHNYAMMNMDDSSLDSQMTNGYDKMVDADRFMDFIITISAHGPFDLDNIACSTHLDEVLQYSQSSDIVYNCGLAQAKETDYFIRNLLEKLNEDGHINDTVLIFYTDHYAYGTIDEETEFELKGTNDPNLLSNVPFFIWANDIEPITFTNVTSTVDVLPTIANMFDLIDDYSYFIGKDAFSNETPYVFFEDGSIYDGNEYYVPSLVDSSGVSEQMKSYIVDARERLQTSWNVLTVDYFRDFERR